MDNIMDQLTDIELIKICHTALDKYDVKSCDNSIVILLERLHKRISDEMSMLKKENEYLKAHIMAQPDGPIFFEAMASYYSHNKN